MSATSNEGVGQNSDQRASRLAPSATYILPDGTFGEGAQTKEIIARRLLMVTYLAILLGTVFFGLQRSMAGAQEVSVRTEQFDRILAPSFVICPFTPNDTLVTAKETIGLARHEAAHDGQSYVRTAQKRSGGVVREEDVPAVAKEDGEFPLLSAAEFQNKDVEYLWQPRGKPKQEQEDLIIEDCQYDRSCKCVTKKQDKFFTPGCTNWRGEKFGCGDPFTGVHGLKSERRMDSRTVQSMEVRTRLRSKKGDALKIGIHRKKDLRPCWFYVGHGKVFLGRLSLYIPKSALTSKSSMKKTNWCIFKQLCGEFRIS